MSAIGKVAIEGFNEGLLTHTEASGVLKRELGVQYLEDGAANEGAVLTLSVEEAKTLVEYLDVTECPAAFRLANRSLYDTYYAIKEALAA